MAEQRVYGVPADRYEADGAQSPGRPPPADEGFELPSERVESVTPPVVIFGAPRSGTTYVNAILNAHPGVHITHETRLFMWAHLTLNTLENDQVALTHREQFREYLKPELARLIRGFYRELDPSATVWGDKNPHYAAPRAEGVLELVEELFPGTKFIHVVRDGRDVVASLVRKRTQDGEPWVSFETAHQVWNGHVATGLKFATNSASGRVLEVRYEELIADDVEMARRMFDFIGIDCSAEVIEFCEGQREKRTPMQGPTRDLSHGVDQSDWETVVAEEGRRAESLNLLRENLVRCGYRVEPA
jgi:protein-tyrosine sulfotransferase